MRESNHILDAASLESPSGSGIKLDIARWTADLRNMATANQSYLAYHGDGYGYQLNNSGTDYYCTIYALCEDWRGTEAEWPESGVV